MNMNAQRSKKWLSFAVAACVLIQAIDAWLPSLHNNDLRAARVRLLLSTSNPLWKDEAAWKAEGETIIIDAAVGAGAKEEMVAIDWKSGRVIVTVDGSAYIPALVEDDDVEVEFDSDDEEEALEGFVEEEWVAEEVSEDAVDVVAIARAINAAFEAQGEGSIGYSIAVHHEIEVSTPGATDELSGIMFESYKGFDVVLEVVKEKTGKIQRIEGKLIERDEEFTRLNEKGRPRKFKNELVKSVKLPKAKKEKGVR